MERTIPGRGDPVVKNAKKAKPAPGAEMVGEHDDMDMVDLIRTQPHAFPLEVAGWNILIEMVRPKEKMGSFYKPLQQVQNEQYLISIGHVIAAGPTCMQGKTASGIELSQLTDTITTREQLIGKFVIHQMYTGHDMSFAPVPGKRLRFITATEILGITTVPTLFMRQ